MRVKPITLVEVEYSAFRLARDLMKGNEPIPAFGTRFPNVLESCLQVPFARFSRKDLYKGLIGKASILFYLMIKNHPFENGNKRIAVISLLYLLAKNGKWLRISNVSLYELAKYVAASNPRQKDITVAMIQVILKDYLTTLAE